ncbi:MAG: hypothetical protein ACRCT8_11475 [Lacipirellulaceae bacterium]
MADASTRRAAIAIACAIVTAGGCRSMFTAPVEGAVSSPLRSASASNDSVTLDIYWATLPADVEADAESLWNHVQEQRLDQGVRRSLVRNGLRAGVVGGAPPLAIAGLLDPKGARFDAADDSQTDDAVGTLADPTGVQRKTTQTRPGQTLLLKASEVLDEAVVLEPGGVGETYQRVQAMYNVEVEKLADGGYAVVLTPELHVGEPRWKWTQDDTGMIARQAPLRDKRVFGELRIVAPLVVGEMLMVTSPPDAGSRLGSYFHRAEEGAPGERKAILVRLTQVPSDRALEGPRSGDDVARL